MKGFLVTSLLLLTSALSLASQTCQADLPQIDFISIPTDSFIMGTPDLVEAQFEIPATSSTAIADEQPAHKVTLSAFEIGQYEITQGQWFAIMGSKPGPEELWQHPRWQQLPAVSISWQATQEFIRAINKQDKNFNYRLPTEAEWEYVSRAGSNDLRPFEQDDLDEYAWVLRNSGDVPHPVGQRKPNAFGAYDMFGNAWEWVNDWYQPDAYAKHVNNDPQGPSAGRLKVRRGGSYHCAAHLVRSAYRAADPPQQRYSVLGFRLVRTPR